jgi:hypothetical protein
VSGNERSSGGDLSGDGVILSGRQDKDELTADDLAAKLV